MDARHTVIPDGRVLIRGNRIEADEFERLVANPETAVSGGLGLYDEAVKYAEVEDLLGGETSTQGAFGDPRARGDGNGDGLGAKLVWSPRSNLQLYGETATVYDALAEGVLVSLGTDWTPSCSADLLGELKVADRALRDPRVLGTSRDEVHSLSIAGRTGRKRKRVERRLDRTIVDMATRNPALTLHWNKYVGSIKPGLRADLMLIRQPKGGPERGLPRSPYRSLIEADERNVRLVMVDGQALVAGVKRMRTLSPPDFEVLRAPAIGYRRAIDETAPRVPGGNQTYAEFRGKVRAALAALGGVYPASWGRAGARHEHLQLPEGSLGGRGPRGD
jgi:hypothetical protein